MAGTASGPPGAQTPAGVRDRRRIRASHFFVGAAIGLGISAFLPWTLETIKVAGIETTAEHKLTDGGAVYLVAFAGVLLWLAYLAYKQRPRRGLLIGSWVVTAWLVTNIVILFNAVDNLQKTSQSGDSFASDTVTPDVALLPALIGAVAAVVASIMLQRSRVRGADVPSAPAAAPSADARMSWDGAAWRVAPAAPMPSVPPPPPAPVLSADGRWSWNGSAWVEVQRTPPA